MAQHRRAVGERAFAGQVARRRVEHARAAASMPRAPSASEKCVISVISSTCGSAFKPLPGGAKRRRREAEPVHAAVQLQEHALRLRASCARASQSICASRCTMCHRCRREHGSRSRGSKQPSSSSIGPRQPQLAHALGLGQVEQREAVGAAQAFVRALDAVAVGIGLDHRPDLRVAAPRRARARRLCASASVWIRAWIGRGIVRVDSASARDPGSGDRHARIACYNPRRRRQIPTDPADKRGRRQRASA